MASLPTAQGPLHHIALQENEPRLVRLQHDNMRHIAAHIDRTCAWSKVGSQVLLVHFKGESKPQKHILPLTCPCGNHLYRMVDKRLSTAPVDPHSSLDGTSPNKGCRLAYRKGSARRRLEDGWRGTLCRRWIGAEAMLNATSYLQRGEWYGMARMAGLQRLHPSGSQLAGLQGDSRKRAPATWSIAGGAELSDRGPGVAGAGWYLAAAGSGIVHRSSTGPTRYRHSNRGRA